MKTSLVLIGLLLFIFVSTDTVKGQVVYTDLEPDIVINDWNVYGFHLAEADSTIPYGDLEAFYIWKHPNSVQINTFGPATQVLCDADNFVLALEKNDVIDENCSVWKKPGYFNLNDQGTSGYWIGVQDKYLGLRFKMGGGFHYGWARLDVATNADSFVLKGYAYESTEEKSIMAGDDGTSSGVDNLNTMQLTLYQSQNAIVIMGLPQGEKQLQLTDISGRLVHQAWFSTSDYTIAESGLRKGVYILSIVTNGAFWQQKLII